MSSYQYAQASKNKMANDLRQRKQAPTSNGTTLQDKVKKEDAGGSVILDVARTVVFLVLASCALSYLVTRESFVWGVKRPSWTNPDMIKAWLVRVFSSILFFHSYLALEELL